jgi:predicted permease
MHLFYELTFMIVSFFCRSIGTMDLIDTQTLGFIIAFLVAFAGLVIACSKRFPNGKSFSYIFFRISLTIGATVVEWIGSLTLNTCPTTLWVDTH